jgi:hypothetical protein
MATKLRDNMEPEHRRALLELLSRLDQNVTEADQLAPLPMYADVAVLPEELRELLIDMRATVEQHLDNQRPAG